MTARTAEVAWLVTSLMAAAEAGVGIPGHGFMRFPVPEGGAGGIAVGPTGDVWFRGNDRISSLRTGVIDQFATPTTLSSPLRITAQINDLIASVTSALQGCSP